MTTISPEGRSFIEVQFPVAQVSAEAYKERKAGASQTLTGLGKWWGRKPLVLVRAALLGLLLPATEDPRRDREIFLKLMTMDRDGLWQRKSRPIAEATLLDYLRRMPPAIRQRFLERSQAALRPLSREERAELERLVFERMPYTEKIQYCVRPEQVEGPTPEAWAEINAHLGAEAHSLAELVQTLGQRRFGRTPRVGDAFCGGGSVPFEAARLGCEVFGSDLNPMAALLTWAALNLLREGKDAVARLRAIQEEIIREVDRQIVEWGIEHNAQGWRADVYLYCVEAACPECGWRVPLAPSWVISTRLGVVAQLLPDEAHRRFDIAIREGVGKEDLARAEASGTVRGSRLHCPHCGRSTPIEVLRRNLRLWEAEDLAPRPEDVFQERLYCIRWVEKAPEAQGQARARRHYRAPTGADLQREAKVLDLLRERWAAWRERGYVPAQPIEPGDETDRLPRERGWTHWHHLFAPRQLLALGLLHQVMLGHPRLAAHREILLRGMYCVHYSSKLCPWHRGRDELEQSFYNQALNTLFNYGVRAGEYFQETFRSDWMPLAEGVDGGFSVVPEDARAVGREMDLWLTDPPYADAVNYHELSEFFLAWYGRHLQRLFPGWYGDSKRALAIRGGDALAFRQGMLAAYRNLLAHTSAAGMHLVMFTHQDPAVWADLTLILWAAGLHVTQAWTIATETASGLKQGNYVQGTVLLVCRRRTQEAPLFLDELIPRIEREVRAQLDEMRRLDDPSQPSFGDTDYQLAAYAAALRVLTAQPVADLDPERELVRLRPAGEENSVERVIRLAVKIALDSLLPRGIERPLWRTLREVERFYLKGLEMEVHGERRSGAFQDLARGFGVAEYAQLLARATPNETRLKTPREFGRRYLGNAENVREAATFAETLTRHVLFALAQAEEAEDPARGLGYLKTELPDYWELRENIIHLLEYFAALRQVSGMEHWHRAAESAEILAARVRYDHI